MQPKQQQQLSFVHVDSGLGWNLNWVLQSVNHYSMRYPPREGEIIEWPLNDLSHKARDIIMTFWTDVLEVDDDDDELLIFTLKRC